MKCNYRLLPFCPRPQLPPMRRPKQKTRKEIKLDRKLRAAFEAMDADKSGSIDLPEFRALCERLDPRMSEAVIEKAAKAIDNNGDGEITFEEYKEWWVHGDRTVMGQNFMVWNHARTRAIEW